MPEPFTLAFLAANCVWGGVKGLGGQVAVAGAKRLGKAIRDSQTPENHDVLAATHAAFVRSIQLMADACDKSGSNPKDQFSARALYKLANDPNFTTFRFGTEGLPKRALDASIRSIFQGGNPDPAFNAANAVIAQTELAMKEPLTETFRSLFRIGSDKHRSWPQAFELFFAEEVKEKPRVFNILTVGRLNEVVAFAEAHASELAELHGTIRTFRQEMHERFDGVDDKLERILARLSAPGQDAPIALLRSLTEAFGEAKPEANVAELELYLRDKIGEYHQLRERIDAIQHEDNHDAALLADANLAFGRGDFERAEELLRQAEESLDERIDRFLIRKSERRALRGDGAKLKGDDAAAVVHYDAAAEMLPPSAKDAFFTRVTSAAETLQDWGRRVGEPDRVRDAVARFQALLNEPKFRFSDDQRVQLNNGLGNALGILGEWEQGQETLHASVSAYRVALSSVDRRRDPVFWAGLQNNIGNVLSHLGERETGGRILKKAVEAYEAALKVYTKKKHGLMWAMVQNNLSDTLRTIGQREKGTQSLKSAASSARKALQFYTREQHPQQWAVAKNHLGNALSNIGKAEKNTPIQQAAAAAYREAATAITREDAPLRWAMIQNNLGNVLSDIGAREDDIPTLEQGAAAYRDANAIYGDRLPLERSTTTENLGLTLLQMALRTRDCLVATEAVAALEDALEVFRQSSMEHHRARAEQTCLIARAVRERLCNVQG